MCVSVRLVACVVMCVSVRLVACVVMCVSVRLVACVVMCVPDVRDVLTLSLSLPANVTQIALDFGTLFYGAKVRSGTVVGLKCVASLCAHCK
jgi:hypothetical protein